MEPYSIKLAKFSYKDIVIYYANFIFILFFYLALTAYYVHLIQFGIHSIVSYKGNSVRSETNGPKFQIHPIST